MERRFRARLDELRTDAEVHADLLRGMAPRLEGFVRPFAACLGSDAQRRNATGYVRGLLSNLGAKTAEAIAYLHDRDRQGLQKFIGQADWDHEPLLAELTRQVGVELGEPDAVLVFDPSAFPKKGAASVGVQRQWCGRLGKLDNCQVGIYLAYVSRREPALADVRLYLPKEWTTRTRRREAGVPTAVGFRTRHELALEMLDEHGPALPHGWVSGDDEMGRSSWFRQQLRARGERYLLAVPSNTSVRDVAAPDPPYTGHGRPPVAPFGRADRWAACVPAGAWQVVEVRDGEKGPVVVQAARTLVQARADNRASDVVEWLVVFRERQADDTWKHDYLLSNAPLATPVAEFARVFKAQHRVEECLKRAKGEAGLGDYQVRTWEGWHHHQALSLIATWFLTQEARRGKKADPGVDRAAGPGGDRADPESAPRVRPPGPHPTDHEPPLEAERGSPVLPLEATQTLAPSSA
ncbi:MAG TPA: IS701 family transposase [Gemmataceae bacterium]|nr:IS701 family transposase [Gemmataceae bacterium]